MLDNRNRRRKLTAVAGQRATRLHARLRGGREGVPKAVVLPRLACRLPGLGTRPANDRR